MLLTPSSSAAFAALGAFAFCESNRMDAVSQHPGVFDGIYILIWTAHVQ